MSLPNTIFRVIGAQVSVDTTRMLEKTYVEDILLPRHLCFETIVSAPSSDLRSTGVGGSWLTARTNSTPLVIDNT